MQSGQIRAVLARQHIETPSWAYGNSGTRFRMFGQPGVPRDPFEKIADAAVVHRLTGVAPTVAIHNPWDRTDDYAKLAQHARNEGVAIGAVNPNTFQDDDYRLGSVCNPDPQVRRKAIDHLVECVAIAQETGSHHLSLWFADGTNYPGQDSIRARQDRMAEALAETYAAMPPDMTLLVEHKFYEPAFYQTDLPDWGTSLLHCLHLGERAKVLVDTGHHAPGTNIEMIVATLLREGRLGGFHFNSRFYGDDDLDALGDARSAGDVLGAQGVLMDAYNADVRPLLAQVREDMGLDPDPVAAYHASGYAKTINAERVGGSAAGWGA